MREWHKQLIKHDPANGYYGDCIRACVANLLQRRPIDIPHFNDNVEPEVCDAAMRVWLKQRGYRLLRFALSGDMSLDAVLTVVSSGCPDVHYMLSGTSRNNCGHVVVCRDAKIVFDPAIDDSGIIGPMPDGYWYIEFIGADV